MANLEEILNAIHSELAKKMLEQIQSGEEISPAGLSVIRQFLKDNNITSIPAEGSPLGDLKDAMGDLPDFSDQDVINFPR